VLISREQVLLLSHQQVLLLSHQQVLLLSHQQVLLLSHQLVLLLSHQQVLLLSHQQVLLLSHHVILLAAVTDQIENCKLMQFTGTQIIQNTMGCFGNMILVPPVHNFLPHLSYHVVVDYSILDYVP
jgi:hypothetical protein